MKTEQERNLDSLLGWEYETGQKIDSFERNRRQHTPEDGKKPAAYSTWEELVSNPYWSKYFVDPGDVFDKKNEGKKMHGRQRKRRKWIHRQETLRQRRQNAITNADYVVGVISINRYPLTPDCVFYFNKPNGARTTGINLGYIISENNFDINMALQVVNLPRLGPEGGLQMLADLFGKPLLATNRKYVSQEYLPRNVRGEYVD